MAKYLEVREKSLKKLLEYVWIEIEDKNVLIDFKPKNDDSFLFCTLSVIKKGKVSFSALQAINEIQRKWFSYKKNKVFNGDLVFRLVKESEDSDLKIFILIHKGAKKASFLLHYFCLNYIMNLIYFYRSKIKILIQKLCKI